MSASIISRPANRTGELSFNEDQLLAALCRRSYFRFVQEMWGEVVAEAPVWNWHVPEMCGRLQSVCERLFEMRPKMYDGITNLPPGMSKSLIHSVMLPAWCWTRMPSFKFIGASYSYPLAQELSVKTRDVVQSDKYRRLFPEVEIREDQNTKGHFKTTGGGGRYAVGVNGSVTGFHGHLIMVDDPLDPNQSVSPADLEAANRWLRETLGSRKVSKTASVMWLVMQRLHQNDPTAQMRRKNKVFWLCLPAADEDTVRPARLKANYQDGLLDPVRLPRQVLGETEREMGEQAYAAQYRQHPVPQGGAMFKVGTRWAGDGGSPGTHVVAPSPSVKFVRLMRFWDKAGTLGGRGPFTCGVLMGATDGGPYWVLDVVRFRLDVWGREAAIVEQAKLDDRTWGEVTVGLEQEPGSGGKESLEATVRRLGGRRLWWWKVDASTGGKELRAEPLAAQVNAGNVYLAPGSWNDEFVTEFKFFPHSRYKDQVDAATGAFTGIAGGVVRVGGLK